MDLTSFKLLRRPSLPACDKKKNAPVIGQLVSYIASKLPITASERAAFTAEINEWKSKNPDPLVWGKKGKSCFEPDAGAGVYYSLQYLYIVLGQVDRFLSGRSDNPRHDEFNEIRDNVFRDITEKFLQLIIRRASPLQRLIILLLRNIFYRQISQAVLWKPELINKIFLLSSIFRKISLVAGNEEKPIVLGVLVKVRGNICDWIAAEMSASERDLKRIQALTHMLLVLDLLDTGLIPAVKYKSNEGDSQVWDCLHRRIAVMPEQYSHTLDSPKVELVREAKVSDLFVVRSEWRGYVAGEAANILNVLAGETFEQKIRSTDEKETTVTEASETAKYNEQSQEDSSQTELSREISRDSALEIKAEGGMNVSGSYGTTQFGASAQFGVSASMSENSRQASKIARNTVSKAISKVESRVREERINRSLTRVINQVKHSIQNRSSSHVSGIYRWVDRIDRYQLFRYPDRLQLEFEIPEPAEYLRYRFQNPQKGDTKYVPKPPDYDLVVMSEIESCKITEDNYTYLAVKYHASNVPPPPDREISIGVAMSDKSEMTPEKEPTENLIIPLIKSHVDQDIKQGYRAKSMKISAVASPLYAHWRNEGKYNGDDTSIEGFHSIRLSVLAGGEKWSKPKGGYDLQSGFSVQLSDDILFPCQRTGIPFDDAFLIGESDEVKFDYDIVEKLSIDMTCSGAASAVVTCIIKCERTEEAYEEWQNSVYDILLDAWKAWNRDWLSEQLQLGGTKLSPMNSTSPARNKEIIKEELKRQVIAWLLDKNDFSGVDAMYDTNGDWLYYNIDKAKEYAPIIQFMEQAFEWSNMSYMLYPYYWARGEMWDKLADLEGNDEDYVRFCRAGSARVVVPARPEFDFAVYHWLMYQEPFMGDSLPVPGDPLYVSVAQEIRDITGAPDDGEPQDSWEARMSTALMWLDPSDKLPHNERNRLGLPPFEPKNPLY